MKRVILPVALALFLVALLGSTVGAQSIKAVFDGVVADWVTVIGDVTVGDDLTVTDGFTVGGTTSFATINTTGNIYSGGSVVSAGEMRVDGNGIVTGTFNATGNSSTNGTFGASGAMSTGGNMSTALFYKATNQGNLTITEGVAFTPTGTFQGLTAAGSVSTGQMTVLPTGSIVTLINFGSNTITLTETSNTVQAGDVALGQYDNITYFSDGTRMIQVAATNN